MNRTLAAESALLLLLVSMLGRGWIPAARATEEAQRRVTGSAAAQHPAANDQKDQPDGPWIASQSLLAGRPELAAPTVSNAEPWSIPGGISRSAMIAIVPDPVRTHLALTFDRTIEAIQLAASRNSYDADRYWLPWRTTAGRDGEALNASTEPAEPGLLLFRADAPSRTPSVLFVFVVGETPTGGINGRQFRNALDYADAVSGSSSARQDIVRVIGPSFSGSLASLRQLAGSRPLHVFSGSVSSLCAIAAQGLTATWPLDVCAPPDGAAPATTTIVFKSFVHATELALSRFVLEQYPDPEHQCIRPHIAVLSETATAFGTKVAEATTRADPASKVTTAAGAPWGRCVESVVFPREIASLRNAAGTTETQRPQASPDAPNQPLLPFNLTDPSNASDAPPDFSKTQGPLSKESVLMNIAAGLRRSRYRMIGLVGTNVIDTVFLADFLRRKCPDSRLFMIGADLIFERQVDNLPYLGTLALTSRPLVAEAPWLKSQSSGASAPPELPFADDYEGGTYDAASSAIGEIAGAGAPDASAGAGDGDVRTADLWMTVVGAGGYWPVKLFDTRPGSLASQALNGTTLEPAQFSSAWRTLLVLVLAAALAHIVVLLTASPYAMHNRDFAPVRAAANQRIFFIQTSTAVIALGVFLLGAPVWRYGEGLWATRYILAVALAGVILCAGCLEAIYVLRWRWRRRDRARHDDAAARTLIIQLAWLSGVWVLAGLLAFLWWRLLDPHQPAAYGYLFAYRVIHPTSGVSPLAPILPLLIAIYGWSCFEVWRLRFNGSTRARLTLSSNSTAPLERQRAEEDVASAIGRPWLRMPHAAAFAALFVIWLLFFHPHDAFVLFEGRAFAALFGVLFCLVVGLMLSSGLRMVQIWTSLRRLLAELERSRVRRTFTRLQEKSWSFWRQGGESADWMYMARSLETLRPLSGRNLACRPFVAADGYIAAGIRACHGAVGRIAVQVGRADYDAKADITAVTQKIGGLRTILAAGAYPALLQGALQEASGRLEGCLVLSGTGDARTLRQGLQLASENLDMALALGSLASGSDVIRAIVARIREPLEVFRGKQPVAAALRSLVEYWRGARSRRAADAPRAIAAVAIETWLETLQETLAAVLEQALPVLDTSWKGPAIDDADAARDTKKAQDGKLPDDFQLDGLAEFVALRHVVFIRGVLPHLRHVMIFVALSFSLALLSLNVYSFEPHQSLIWSFTAIFVVTGLLIVSVLAQLHRDPILSRMTGTTANALDWHFYLRVAAFGAVPLFTLLTTYFPSIGRQLVSFVGPSLDAFK